MMRFWKFRYGLPLLVHSVWIVSPVVGDPCDSAAPAAAAFAACCCAPAAFAAAPERTATWCSSVSATFWAVKRQITACV